MNTWSVVITTEEYLEYVNYKNNYSKLVDELQNKYSNLKEELELESETLFIRDNDFWYWKHLLLSYNNKDLKVNKIIKDLREKIWCYNWYESIKKDNKILEDKIKELNNHIDNLYSNIWYYKTIWYNRVIDKLPYTIFFWFIWYILYFIIYKILNFIF